MLFAVKNHWLISLALAVAMAGLAALIWSLLGIPESLFAFGSINMLLAGILVVAASDALGHGLMCFVFGDAYRRRYCVLVDFFRPQHAAAILMGGVLAACEELVFRGVLLEQLLCDGRLSTGTAVFLSAIVFGAFHLIPRRAIWVFGIWAVWEGVLLGAFYFIVESLPLSMILHGMHDVLGFGLFAFQRKTGWMT